jgi:hypothetical protein
VCQNGSDKNWNSILVLFSAENVLDKNAEVIYCCDEMAVLIKGIGIDIVVLGLLRILGKEVGGHLNG